MCLPVAMVATVLEASRLRMLVVVVVVRCVVVPAPTASRNGVVV